uniref:Uncharacterized protein n=1 Tax=Moniliophthora roreri TaxID=221103 RepID=A0A0W0F3V3_MONRR
MGRKSLEGQNSHIYLDTGGRSLSGMGSCFDSIFVFCECALYYMGGTGSYIPLLRWAFMDWNCP